MQVSLINTKSFNEQGLNVDSNKPSFGHGIRSENNYTKKQKALVATTTALGVAASLALLAKSAKYSLKPSKMFKDFKKSYLWKVEYHDKEVISIGLGSCLGGLAGGCLIDKNKENRKSKLRESVMQIGNISIPILTVEAFAKQGAKVNNKVKALAAVAGIFIGIYLANFLMNLLSNAIFKDKSQERGVKATDFSAHLDDAIVAANCVSKHPIIHAIARVVPLALMFAGNEVGNKTKNYKI